MKIIDLSVTISEKIKEPLPTKIVYEDHKEGAKKMGGKLFEGLTDVFIDGNGPAGEFLTVTSHCGTHVDAPYHYFPTSEGKPARTIDEMPLEWFFQDGVVLDFTDKPDGYMFEPEDLQEKLDALGDSRFVVGAAQFFNNANNCVKGEFVNKLVGNDINFDGGYGEDNDFGLSLTKIGVAVLQNPFSNSLHLKPPVGGYRFWGNQAKILGKKRKKQPWELDTPVRFIRPIPSPTVMYFYCKHFGIELIKEYRHKYFVLFLFKGSKALFLLRLLKIPFKQLQFNKSLFYAKKLMDLGRRTS